MQQVELAPPVKVLPSGLITREDFATYIGVEVGTLAQWAWKKYGPPVRKIGGRAYYRFSEVQAFVGADNERQHG